MEGEYYYEIYVIQAFTSSKSQFVDTFSSCDNTTSSFFSTDLIEKKELSEASLLYSIWCKYHNNPYDNKRKSDLHRILSHMSQVQSRSMSLPSGGHANSSSSGKKASDPWR